MILTCIDNWIQLDNSWVDFDQYDIIEFKHVFIVNPGQMQVNQEEPKFGMSCWETFRKMKNRIAYQLTLQADEISLLWKETELEDEDCPDDIGMEVANVKLETLEIHINARGIEN